MHDGRGALRRRARDAHGARLGRHGPNAPTTWGGGEPLIPGDPTSDPPGPFVPLWVALTYDVT